MSTIPHDTTATSFAIRILALHGFTGVGADFRLLESEAFPRWITPDLPGHGSAGDLPVEAFALDRFSADMRAELSGSVVGLGYSMGGRLLLHLAVRHPEFFTALVLVGASPGLADPAERRLRVERDRRLADEIRSTGTGAFLEKWSETPLIRTQKKRIPAEHFQHMREPRARQRAEGLARSLEQHGTGKLPSLWEELPRLRPPVLLCTGADDEKFQHIAAEMKSRLPYARTAVIPNAGHAAHLENAPAFLEAMRVFLDGR